MSEDHRCKITQHNRPYVENGRKQLNLKIFTYLMTLRFVQAINNALKPPKSDE